MVARELAGASITAEYIAVVDPDTFAPLERIEQRALIALAARVGPVRLIDNMEVAP